MARALLVDHDALRDAQARGDVLEANRLLQDAFQVDVRPALAELRIRAGLPADPIGPTSRAARPRSERRPAPGRRRGELVMAAMTRLPEAAAPARIAFEAGFPRSARPGPERHPGSPSHRRCAGSPATATSRATRPSRSSSPTTIRRSRGTSTTSTSSPSSRVAASHESEHGIDPVSVGTVIFIPPGVSHEYRGCEDLSSTTACSARTSTRPS